MDRRKSLAPPGYDSPAPLDPLGPPAASLHTLDGRSAYTSLPHKQTPAHSHRLTLLKTDIKIEGSSSPFDHGTKRGTGSLN